MICEKHEWDKKLIDMRWPKDGRIWAKAKTCKKKDCGYIKIFKTMGR